MKKQTLLFTVAFTFLSMFTFCSKKETPEATPDTNNNASTNKLCVLKNSVDSLGETTEYEFDSNGRLTKVGSNNRYLTFVFNGNNLTINWYKNDSLMLSNSGTLNSSGNILSIKDDYNDMHFEYNSEGYLLRVYSNADSTGSFDFTYKYSNGNLIQQVRRNTSLDTDYKFESIDTVTNEYYLDKTALVHFPEDQDILGPIGKLNKNLVKHSFRKMYNLNYYKGTLTDTQINLNISDFTYELNKEGYPVSRREFRTNQSLGGVPNSETNTIKYTYTCP